MNRIESDRIELMDDEMKMEMLLVRRVISVSLFTRTRVINNLRFRQQAAPASLAALLAGLASFGCGGAQIQIDSLDTNNIRIL